MKDLGRLADGIEALLKQLQASQDQNSSMLRHLRHLAESVQVRENSHHDITHDTATATVRTTRMTDLFGVKANSLTVINVGGGTLEVSIDGGRFIPVAVGATFNNENIEVISLRVTTPAAGTAVVRAGAYVPPAQGLRMEGAAPGVFVREVL